MGKKKGVTHKIAGIRMGGDPITWYASDFYHVFHKGELVGYVSSAWYSPTQESNIALADRHARSQRPLLALVSRGWCLVLSGLQQNLSPPRLQHSRGGWP